VEEKRKILIAYDGSRSADAAVDDLRRAGLPDNAEAIVFSVVETWLPPPSSDEVLDETPFERPTDEIEAVRTIAGVASERLRSIFPAWRIDVWADYGPPARKILEKAEVWKPDLIVVGSHGRTSVGQFLLGSVSHTVATKAPCSVRIARGRVEEDSRPVRILIGVGGSAGGTAAVREVARRRWPEGSQVELVSSFGPFNLYVPDVDTLTGRIRALHEHHTSSLVAAGLEVASTMREGDPKHVLVDEATRWEADAIFLGTRSLTQVGRLFLGSVSTAVATRARCSVEIVRGSAAAPRA
jgi:nucleotide-binding universal stress UspA family protein